MFIGFCLQYWTLDFAWISSLVFKPNGPCKDPNLRIDLSSRSFSLPHSVHMQSPATWLATSSTTTSIIWTASFKIFLQASPIVLSTVTLGLGCGPRVYQTNWSGPQDIHLYFGFSATLLWMLWPAIANCLLKCMDITWLLSSIWPHTWDVWLQSWDPNASFKSRNIKDTNLVWLPFM